MYIQEGGTKVYRPQATRWTGNIALAYPSDWTYLGCNQNSWLYISQTESKIDELKYEEWLLSNAAYSSYGVFYVEIGSPYFSVKSERNVCSNSISVRLFI